jgi:hypothetical protein
VEQERIFMCCPFFDLKRTTLPGTRIADVALLSDLCPYYFYKISRLPQMQ